MHVTTTCPRVQLPTSPSALQGTILQRLKVVTASSAASVELRERQSEVQGHLCTVLWTIMRKLCDSDLGTAGKEAEAPLADGIMVALLEVITSHPGTVHQQALNACGQLAWVVGDRFDNYMHHFWPILTRALEAYQQEQTLRTGERRVGLAEARATPPRPAWAGGKQHERVGSLETVYTSCTARLCFFNDLCTR